MTGQTGGINRRQAIRWGMAGFAALPLARFAFAAERVEEDDPIAQTLGYRHEASQAQSRGDGQFCKNCAFFQGEGDDWGPCLVFAGKAVNSGGWCSSWRAKEN